MPTSVLPVSTDAFDGLQYSISGVLDGAVRVELVAYAGGVRKVSSAQKLEGEVRAAFLRALAESEKAGADVLARHCERDIVAKMVRMSRWRDAHPELAAQQDARRVTQAERQATQAERQAARRLERQAAGVERQAARADGAAREKR